MAGDPHQAPGPAAEPGVHEIVLTVPADGVLCNSLTCARQGKPAEVVVTFGRLSGRWFDPGALWPECWGKSYPNCAGCWDRARRIAHKHRPGLVVRDCRPPAPPGPPAEGRGGR